MSDSAGHERVSDYPPSPPLMDVLAVLASTLYDLIPTDSSDSRMASAIIQCSATWALTQGIPFTKTHLADDLVQLNLSPNVCQAVHRWMENGDLDSLEEVTATMEWVCRRINALTGTPITEIREAVQRQALGKAIDLVHGETDRSLNQVAKELRQLDERQKSEIWQHVWRECRVLRELWQTRESTGFAKAGAPIDKPHAVAARLTDLAVAPAKVETDGKPTCDDDEAPLSDRQVLILETMLQHEITSHSRRETQASIVRKINPKHKAASYGRAFSNLVKEPVCYLESAEGPEGGMWINPRKRSEVEQLLKRQ
jgi:hypothetical protein